MKPRRPNCWSVLTLIGVVFSGLLNAQIVDIGKSYINITKGINGGTLEPGDTLEIRASFVVRSGTLDSCAYYDAVPAGTAYIPGTIRVLTNEGKIYKQFTDAIPDDPGWINGSNIQINLGYNPAAFPATRFRRGRVANTYRPKFGGSSILLASFRVRVTAGYGTQISTGGGFVIYKNGPAAIQTATFPSNRVAVYRNFSICANTVGANALGTEFNGSFGSGKSRNRGSSANVPVGYTYNIFTANTPNDYYYGIANNTSTQLGYTTSDSWPKPDPAATTRRVFRLWDIIGDHTGAVSPVMGNPAADTVANSNAGYMLVVNAAYRIDSAFQQTISNLCPNTYYEISCWMRNICSKCGADSTGTSSGTVGYIPTGPGDSSGVCPNLTFEVDGLDYYTTGNMTYSGEWVKKGFTFLTGPAQTSFTLKFFNNAPGGGGNDWALDDISVATCSPDLIFTPTNNPTICEGNVVEIGCIIRSYFNNYTKYKWQKSTDNGVTWIDASADGTGTPVWNGSAWEYSVAYPTFVAYPSDNGLKFKVVVATTTANLTEPNCAFSESGSVITLNVIDCDALATNILSFTGKREYGVDRLIWATSKETESFRFIIEESNSKRQFKETAVVLSNEDFSLPVNLYEWQKENNSEVFYRIKMISRDGLIKYSRTIKLGSGIKMPEVKTVNPFNDQLVITAEIPHAEYIQIQLQDASGKLIRAQKFLSVEGINQIVIKNTGTLPEGFYTMKLLMKDIVITKKLIKSNR